MDSFVRARSVLAGDLPDVRGGLLTRYALLVFTAGTDVTEDLVTAGGWRAGRWWQDARPGAAAR